MIWFENQILKGGVARERDLIGMVHNLVHFLLWELQLFYLANY
jgi:hypothetical protein